MDVRGPEDAAGPCVPAHATHVVRELVKNALVATLEAHVAKHGDVPDDWEEAPRAVVVDVDHGYEAAWKLHLVRIRTDFAQR